MFRSTDVPRVYQSVEAFAMGMFPDIMTGRCSDYTLPVTGHASLDI